MRLTLINLAAKCAIYGRATHGLSSVSGQTIAGRNALHLLRWHYTNDQRPHVLAAVRRSES